MAVFDASPRQFTATIFASSLVSRFRGVNNFAFSRFCYIMEKYKEFLTIKINENRPPGKKFNADS